VRNRGPFQRDAAKNTVHAARPKLDLLENDYKV
jgi:hypothetical protein